VCCAEAVTGERCSEALRSSDGDAMRTERMDGIDIDSSVDM
jgi:hypothetical protein